MNGSILNEGTFELLEKLAANSWPPRERRDLGEWRLRATDGVTTRGNSVFAVGDFPNGDWLQKVEGFYGERGLPPCFHVSSSSPSNLDAFLAAEGYEISKKCRMLAALCQRVLSNTRKTEGADIYLASDAGEGWLDDFLRMEEISELSRRGYEEIFAAMPSPKIFAAMKEGNKFVGLASCVVEKEWAGISNVVVDPLHRRKGVAVRMLHALAAWSVGQGAQGMYLQVLEDNAPALELYGKLGFAIASSYHYRIHK